MSSSVQLLPDRFRAWLARGGHGTAGAIAFALLLGHAALGVEPVATWWYPCAWYPAILWMDAEVKKRRGNSLLVDRPLAFLSLWLWSVPFWLLFELLNLRLENWYYVNAPAGLLAGRWMLVLSFATVLPGLVEAYELLGAYGAFASARLRPLPASPRLRAALAAGGALCLGLALGLPRLGYPLAWLFLPLLLGPFNRRPGWPSLLRDLERGRATRVLRLLVAGLLCGVFWEVMNVPARARWIYTVPGFDALADQGGLEMPPLGFLGFPPFALGAYAFVRATEILGLAVPFEDVRGRVAVPWSPLGRFFAWPALVATLSLAAILALENETVDSRSPRTRDLSGAGRREAAALELFGLGDPKDLLRAAREPGGVEDLARRLDVEVRHVQELVDRARLAVLRGLGTRNTALLARVGVDSIEELAGREAQELYGALRALGEEAGHVEVQRVRVWLRAARAAGR